MSDLIDSQRYWQIADIMLFDAKPQENDSLTGGLGRGFNHQLLNDATTLPDIWWLAGGLNDENIADILKQCRHKPATIDLSSSVENVIGVKSRAKNHPIDASIKKHQDYSRIKYDGCLIFLRVSQYHHAPHFADKGQIRQSYQSIL